MEKYYDIEIFNGSPTKIYEPSIGTREKMLYDVLTEVYTTNDSYFLKRLHDRTQKWDDVPNQWFYKILFTFYNYFSGDSQQWLNYTMNIVVAFNDMHTNHWIVWELKNVTTDKKPTIKELLRMHKPQILKRGRVNLKDILLTVGKPYGFESLQSLKNNWYEVIKE